MGEARLKAPTDPLGSWNAGAGGADFKAPAARSVTGMSAEETRASASDFRQLASYDGERRILISI